MINIDKSEKKHSPRRRGIALVSVLSVLTVLSILCIYFLSLLKIQADRNALYLNDLRARLLVRGGLHLAISQLKYGSSGARDNFCDSRLEDWYYNAGVGVDLGSAADANTSFAPLTNLRNVNLGNNLSGVITIKILDSASQINLNDRNLNLATILDNLPGVSAAIAGNIIGYRNGLPGNKFSYEEQLKNVSGMSDALYDQIKDFVTIESFSDEKATTSYNTGTFSTTFSGANSRSPVNVNTAPKEVLEAVLLPVAPGVAANVAANIVTQVSATPFYSWEDFNTFIDGLALGGATANNIKNNANPNRIKPAGYSTEFCFHGGGYYEVEAFARVMRPNGTLVARRRLRALVKVFDIVQHTKKVDFRDEDTNDDGDNTDASFGEGNFDINLETGVRLDNTNYLKTTWLDSCPTDEADDQTWQGYSGADPDNISPFAYRAIPNAVKMGFWDNFDEDTGTNQSRAWWGDEFNRGFNISDVGSGFNYTYVAGDFCDFYNATIFDGTQPTQNRLHTYDDVSGGNNGFYLDDVDNEMWQPGSGSPLQTITSADFSKYFVGGRGLSNNWNSIRPAYRWWNSQNGFYMRLFNYDGPRMSIGTVNNFPGWFVASDPPGRDRQDVGRVELFDAQCQLYLHGIGNVYNPGPVPWGPVWQVDGPRFYVRRTSSYSEPPGFLYQRNKVYKTVCRQNNIYYHVYSSNFTYQHPASYDVSAGYSGCVQMYSSANQSAWDDVRIIDDEGRIAKHFVISQDADVGSFHCNVTVPAGGAAYFMGSSGGGVLQAGTSAIDISLASQVNNFIQTSGSYYPNVNITGLGAGARAIEGPPSGGNTVFSYSIRMTTPITSLTPRVAALEDVSLTYLPPTEIVYYFEQ